MVKRRSEFERHRDLIRCIKITGKVNETEFYMYLSELDVKDSIEGDSLSGFDISIDPADIHDTPVPLSVASCNKIIDSGILEKYVLPEIEIGLLQTDIFRDNVTLENVEQEFVSFFCVPTQPFIKSKINGIPDTKTMFDTYYIMEYTENIDKENPEKVPPSYFVAGAREGELYLVEKTPDAQPFRFSEISTPYNVIVSNPALLKVPSNDKYMARCWKIYTISTLTILQSIEDYESYNKNKQARLTPKQYK